ncbi:hypothetical protein TNCV_2763931 [Trichonephila clavipes]|nr:hypothetical protein TNCV_2763931 [Trichonephila clavipes]
MASYLSSFPTNLTTGFAARRLFKVLSSHEGTIHLQHPCLLRDSNPGQKLQQSVNNHYTRWVTIQMHVKSVEAECFHGGGCVVTWRVGCQLKYYSRNLIEAQSYEAHRQQPLHCFGARWQ